MSVGQRIRLSISFLLLLKAGMIQATAAPAKTTICKYITQARIAYRPDFLEAPFSVWVEERDRLNTNAAKFGHGVESGLGAVLQIHVEEAGSGVDSIAVTELTFEFSPSTVVPVGGEPLDARIIRDSYTFGFPAFYELGNFYSGQGQISSVRISSATPSSLDVNLNNANVLLTRPKTNKGGSLPLTLNIDCTASIIREVDLHGSSNGPRQ